MKKKLDFNSQSLHEILILQIFTEDCVIIKFLKKIKSFLLLTIQTMNNSLTIQQFDFRHYFDLVIK